ncbi:MAG: DUF3127 domain-containing protein [Muribaculaceae bacterium]|nr:DUF3127 domain-containing protein [Muribaculaceae bacterium]
MEIKATILKALPIESGVSKAGKEWQKATLIAQYGDAQYPKKVAITAFKNADKFAAIPVGAEVCFFVDVESHEFNGRWFTGVNCYKWDVLGGVEQTQQPTPPPTPPVDDDSLQF